MKHVPVSGHGYDHRDRAEGGLVARGIPGGLQKVFICRELTRENLLVGLAVQ
jgi:hypothetical protein